MPITQSAKKALRQNARRRARNVLKKEAYKKALKELRGLAAEKKLDEARALLPRVYQGLDKAAKTHVIAKNKAIRLKSRIAKMVRKET